MRKYTELYISKHLNRSAKRRYDERSTLIILMCPITLVLFYGLLISSPSRVSIKLCDFLQTLDEMWKELNRSLYERKKEAVYGNLTTDKSPGAGKESTELEVWLDWANTKEMTCQSKATSGRIAGD